MEFMGFSFCLFVLVCVCLCHGTSENVRETWGRWFSASAVYVLGIDSGVHAWHQAPLSAEPVTALWSVS